MASLFQISRLRVKAVIIWDINEKSAAAVAKDIQEETGIVARGISCDVSDRSDVAKAAKLTRWVLESTAYA